MDNEKPDGLPTDGDARRAKILENIIKWGECFCAVWDGELCLSCAHAEAIVAAGLDWEEEFHAAVARKEIPG